MSPWVDPEMAVLLEQVKLEDNAEPAPVFRA